MSLIPSCSISFNAKQSARSVHKLLSLCGIFDRFRIRRGQRCACNTSAMRESLILSPNIRTMSAAGRRILKPYCNILCISLPMNPTTSGVHADAWVLLVIALSRASLDQGSPVLTGMPSSTYYCRREADGRRTATSIAPNVPHFHEAMKYNREVARWISSSVALDVATR